MLQRRQATGNRQHKMARVTDTHVCLGVLLLQVIVGEEGEGESEGLAIIHSAIRPRAPGSPATATARASAAGSQKKTWPPNVRYRGRGLEVLICQADQCRVKSTDFTRRIAHRAVPL